jgi:4-amino-4-deoxy-L-arabinose transferase-like glycosyltransferase
VKNWTKRFIIFFLGISLVYFVTHLIALTKLPVFADEAIYIRWAQLIIDDWQQYLFFPLNDGKTPLFIWMLVSSLKLFTDPLFAGRFVSVLAGFFQLWAIVKVTRELGGRRMGMIFAAGSVILLPFWFFHHRMALMDGWLTVWLSFALLYLLKTAKLKSLRNILWAGVFFGLALLTKIPALLFMPALIFSPLLADSRKKQLPTAASWTSGALLIGLTIFVSLKLHPAFGQLFNRGNDFLYSFSQLAETGVWAVFSTNALDALRVFGTYLTWPVLLLPIFGLFQDKFRRKHALLILSSLGFIGPMLLLGKTIYPRYMLPAALPLTISAALAFEQFFLYTQRKVKEPLKLFIRSAVLVLFSAALVSQSAEFILVSWKNPDFLPLVPVDRTQYLREWSSGHGIKEATKLMVQESQEQKIAVATEGYFGTLPDGILMYLHNQDVTNLTVHGIGQPVREIPEDFWQKTESFDQVWLVVNSHREAIGLKATNATLLQSYPRLGESPALEVWDITPLRAVGE